MTRFYLTNLPNLLFNFITITNIIYNKQEHYDKITARNRWNTHYDYVIVGAGTSGCVLASKLSEDPTVSVLLLEAGASETVSSNTPGLSDTLLGSLMDWKFISKSQNDSCLGMKDSKCMLSSGKVVGGTSSINRLYYFRGDPSSFDNWQSRLGLNDWSWKDIFPVFIRNENQTDPDRAKSGYFGVSGPVTIEKSREHNPILESFVYASKLAGFRYIDLNTGIHQGTSILQSITRNGRRMSMSSAFLEPNLRRPNLHILSNSVAIKVLFEGNRAVGIEFFRNWKPYTVYADRETIISAGTINTPKLLLLSGIGPSNELRHHRIPIIADLPVGENFHDHVGTYGLHFSTSQPEQAVTKQNLKQYFNSGKGPLAENRFGATIFKLPEHRQTKRIFNLTDSPNVMLLSFTGSMASKELNAQLSEQRIHMNQDVWNAYYKPMKDGKLHFTVMPVLLSPKSRGSITLKSSNPLDVPIVDPAYLRHPQDLQLMVSAIREALDLIKMRPFKLINTQIFKTVVPGCEIFAPKILSTNIFQEKIILKSSANEMQSSTPTTVIPESVIQSNIFKRFLSRYRLKPRIKKSIPIQSRSNRTSNNNEMWFHYFGADESSQQNPSRYQPGNQHDSFLVDGYSFSSQSNPSQSTRKKLSTTSNFTTQKPYPSRATTEMYIVRNSSVPIILVKARPKKPTTRMPSISTAGVPLSTYSTASETSTFANRVSRSTLSSTSSTSSSINTNNKFVVYKNNHQNWLDESANSNYWFSSGVTSPIPQNLDHQHPHSKPNTTPVSVEQTQTSPLNFEEEIPMLESTTQTYSSTHSAPVQLPPSILVEETPNLESIIDSFSNEYLQCMARVFTASMGDYVGTCRMGNDNDENRVVDENFRVVGIHNLRVVDASVVPDIVTGGMQPVAMMLGERAAEFIKDSFKKIRTVSK